jgi:hypothetical protein
VGPSRFRVTGVAAVTAVAWVLDVSPRVALVARTATLVAAAVGCFSGALVAWAVGDEAERTLGSHQPGPITTVSVISTPRDAITTRRMSYL